MTTLQITFVSESTGYQNTLGWYNTRTGEAGIIFLDTNDDGQVAALLEVEQADLDAGYIGFFLIPNGALRYGTGEDSVLNGPLTFDTKGNGDGQILDADGDNLTGAQGEVIFSDPTLNKKDADYTQGDDDGSILGQIAFEDLVKKSDGDFDDLIIDVQVYNPNRPPVVEDQAFDVDENSAAGTLVGLVAASDPDAGQDLTYEIIAGNDSGAFVIDAITGAITVAEGAELDFETLASYMLTVQVTDGGGLSDTALLQIGVNNVVETLHGNALDGYVAGATVFADQDSDGILDAGEISATTDASGSFTLVDGSGPLVMFGGTDVATGLPFTGILRAPAGATVVTPLTTLIAEIVEAGQSPSAASANVAAAFGLGGTGIDLLSFDPIPVVAAGAPGSGAAAQVLAAGVQVQNAIVQIGALLSGAGVADAHAAIVSALADLVASGAPIDLADAADAQALIEAAAATAGAAPGTIDMVIGDAALVLAATNAAVSDALAAGSGIEVLEALARAAAVAQGPSLTEALAQAGAANDSGTLVAEYTGDTLAAKIADAEIGDVDGGTVGTPGNDVLVGTPGNDLIDGLAGHDLLQGLEGNDRLLGGEGDDTLEGGLGHDFLRGGTGNDVLDGGEVADYQSDTGFRDTDRIDYSTASGGVNVNLATGLASDGDGGTDMLEGIESVTGSAFGDVLAGTMTFSENWRGGGGDDQIDGGGGFDRAEYVDATSGVSISLGGFGGFSTASGAVVGDASVGTDTLLNVESFVGSDFDDTYVAGLFLSASLPGGFFSTFNSIEGRGGNDTITGNGATRVEYTSATGGVTVNLALGFATGNASVGTDAFTGVSDVRGSSFADMLTGGNAAFNGFEGYDGRGGDDYIDGGQGWDRADYAFNGPASTGIHVNLADGIVTGDAQVHGTDTLRGIEAIRGTHLADVFDATGFSEFSTNAGWSGSLNEFQGMAGSDTIIGNGNTRIAHNLAREGVSVDLELGQVVGGASVGVDTIVGGVSQVQGTNFDDTLRGSSGHDFLFGISGNDLLVGGAGNDLMDGGAGIDRVDYSAAGGAVSVDLLFATATDGDGGFDTLFNIENITGSQFGDTLAGNFANNVLHGGMGNDVLRGGGGNDTLDGGMVADFQSDAGFRDDDRADYSTAFSGVTVNFFEGFAFDGEGGMDTLVGIEGVIGSAFDDHFTGSSIWREVYRGGAGDDTIHGGGGFDIAEYSDAPGGITINLGRFDGTVDSSATVFGHGMDTLRDVELFVGSDFDDTYSVGGFSSGAFPGGVFNRFNSFEGRGGDDWIFGDGNTRAEYTSATARVTVDLGAGEAFADDGSVGFDRLFGVSQVRGSSFDDRLIGTFGNETLDGRGGDDFIDGREGFDRADYGFNGPAAHGIEVDLAAGIVTGDAGFTGTDELHSIEAIRGTHLADTYNALGFFGSFGTLNEFEGMAGDDTVIGNGSTRLSFALAREGVTVDLALGKVFGGDSVGTDTVSGVNAMRGSGFGDVFMGTNHGITSAEVYEGRAGDDEYSGRGGFDQARYDSDPTQTGIVVEMAAINTFTGRVTGEAGIIDTDTLIDIVSVVGTQFNDSYDATGYFSTVSGLGAFNEFDGGAGDDTITGNGATRATFLSSFTGVTVDLAAGTASGFASGNDSLENVFSVRGSNSADTLRGSAFDDTFEGRGGNDFINGRDGFDLVRYDNGSSGGGSFIANAAGGFTASAAGHDTDTLVNVESIRGTGFSDLFVGTAAALGFVFDGRGGNDILLGSQGDDGLLGGDGMDLLRGGLGADILNGGAGADRLDFNSLAEAGDIVQGFQTGFGGDVIDIADLLLNETSYAGGPLSAFVRIEAAGLDGLLQINPHGSADPLDWQTLATLQGGAGLNADALVASGNLDVEAAAGMTLTGTEFNDLLVGTPGNDTLIGLLGNDVLRGGTGDDLLDGGVIADLQSDVGFRDTDRADYSAASSGVSVFLGVGIALDGDGGLDTLIGIESVTGSMHDDLLSGSDTTFAENFQGGAGNDVIQGGGGNDRAEYFDATSGVAILATVSGSGFTAAGDASVGFDQLTGVELFNGSEHGDTFNAAAFGAFNAFEGRGGNDFITGNGNTRVEYTNATGAVTVNLATGIASGNDSVGTDTFFGGVNQVRGSAHADTLLGGNSAFDGFESFDGRGGNDFIDGGTGWDRVDYAFNGPITTGLVVNLAAGTAQGDPTLVGMDTLRGIESVRGSHRDDTYDATGFSEFSANVGWFGPSNEFEGMAGNDTVIGNGSTTLAFYSAREGVSVDLQAGTATGGPSVGSDTILGGVFRVVGSNFDDTIIGSFGNEVLVGGNGDDLLRGGGGFDFLDGGPGSDRFDFDSPSDGVDTISFFEAFPGGDVLDIGELLLNWTGYNGGAGGPLSDFARLEPSPFGFDVELQIDVDGGVGPATWQTLAVLFGGGGLTLETLLANGNLDIEGEAVGQTVPGTPGNDFLEGGAGNDTLLGFQGNDTLRGRGGDDVLNGGVIADLQSDAGFRDNDRVDYSTALSGVVVNLLTGTAADDGEGGTDELIGIEAVTGSAFDDTIVGADDTFSESFRGGAGNDHIDGGGGNDLAEYWDASGPLSVTLGGVMGGPGGEASGASVGTDTLLNVERVMGSDFADTFNAFGFASASSPGGFLSRFNAFEGRGGNDVINGNGATRAEYTGATSGVTVDLELGQASGDASVGTDTFSGVSQIRGSSFLDTFLGSQFDDSFDGRRGDDFIDGRGGFDRADYAFNGPASVGLLANLAAGTVEGDPLFSGTDTLMSIEAIRGTHLADTYNAIGFFGSFGTLNEFEGMAGDDVVHGNGNTRLTFANAREGVSVDLAAGTVAGGASVGNDSLMGGINQMRGSNFADTFKGTDHGTTFAEVYEGRAGNDTFEGRGGYDQARYDTDPTQAGITVDMATAAGSNIGTVTGDLWIGEDTLIDIVAVVGTAFSDAYDGSGYSSAVSLGAFNEFEGLGGDDTITGNGSTRVTFISAWAGVTVDLAAGTASGAATGEDTLINIFRVRATNFNDTLLGSVGNDNFDARNGNDVLVGGAGDDILDGGLGFDRVDYSASSGAVTIDLLAGTASDGMGGTDTLANIESMTGSAFDDTLSGTNNGIASAQVYEGRAGNDTYTGRGGFDQARYDADPTTAGIAVDMATAAGTNIGTVTGEAGIIDIDTLIDVVSVVGTAFADTYDAAGYFSPVSTLGAFNEFEGLGGNDVITGNGSTRVSYISASSAVTVDLGAGTASGAATGIDQLINVFSVRGSNFADILTGSIGNDTFEGRGGNDTIDGSGGNDLVRYDNGSFGGGSFIANALGEIVASAPGHDTDTLRNVEQVRGTNFADTFDGSARFLAFTFDGRGGNDTLIGTQDADLLQGGDGDDLLRGGLGGDELWGQAGSDTFDYDLLAESGDTIRDFQSGFGGDVLDIADLLANSTAYNGGAGGPLENFVRVDASGPHSLLQVDPDGGLPSWNTVATLLDRPGLDLSTLIDQGNLDTLL